MVIKNIGLFLKEFWNPIHIKYVLSECKSIMLLNKLALMILNGIVYTGLCCNKGLASVLPAVVILRLIPHWCLIYGLSVNLGSNNDYGKQTKSAPVSFN